VLVKQLDSHDNLNVTADSLYSTVQRRPV